MVDPVQRLSRMSAAFTQPQGYTALEKPKMEAPKELDPKTKANFAARLKETGGRVLSGLGEEYKKGFALMGAVMTASASVKLPEKASAGEIGKFAFRLSLCPFKTFVGLNLTATLALGMVLATPIMAAAKAFPDQTRILFHSRENTNTDQGWR